MFAWSERNPETSAAARAFHRPGHEIQRLIATKEPTPEQLEVSVAALREILRVEQEAEGESVSGDPLPLRRLRRPCSTGSITSASRPTTSRAPSPSTSRPSACPLAHRETVESQGVEAALLDVGDGHVELLRPLGPDTPSASTWRSGARACTTSPTPSTTSTTRSASSRSAGVELIDSEARVGIRNSRVAFLHPRSTGGVLTEIVEPAKEH